MVVIVAILLGQLRNRAEGSSTSRGAVCKHVRWDSLGIPMASWHRLSPLSGPTSPPEMAQTGIVPRPSGPASETGGLRRDLASTLFLTILELVPLLVLFVALTGRNIETIKKLPHEHRILENRAAYLRRRERHDGCHGPNRWRRQGASNTGHP